MLTVRVSGKKVAGMHHKPGSGTLDIPQSNAPETAHAAIMSLDCGEPLVSEDGGTPDSSKPSPFNGTIRLSSDSSESWVVDAPSDHEQTSFAFDEMFVDIPVKTSPMSSMLIDQRAFPSPQLSVFGALWDNGAMLGISCCCDATWRSKPASPEIPIPLQPTHLQQMKVHFTWIDRFPFPRMRDNMISLSGVFNEEDFLESLFKQPSFTLKPGGLSWDPSAWKIAKDFGATWGYLFY